MSSLIDSISQHLSGPALTQLSRQLGTDEGTTGNAVNLALPALIGALAKNASSSGGAGALSGALDRDHDGSLLDDVAGAVSNPVTETGGGGILKHVFGRREEHVAAGVGQATGLDAGKATKLLGLLAPIVLAALARKRRTDGLDAGGLAAMLGHERSQLGGRASGGLGSLLQLIDRDHDGSVVDDVGGMLGGIFKR